jgi:hypothetical protein
VRGDVLLKGRYNGSFTIPPSFPIQVSVEASLAFKAASIGFSATLCCATPMVDNTEIVFVQANDKWTKLAQYKFEQRRLDSVGQHFQAIVQNAYGVGARSSRTIEALWEIPIYGDYTPGFFPASYRITVLLPTVLMYTSG